MIERNHVLILNWLFDVSGRRTPLPPGFHAQLAEALVSGNPAASHACHLSYSFQNEFERAYG